MACAAVKRTVFVSVEEPYYRKSSKNGQESRSNPMRISLSASELSGLKSTVFKDKT